MKKITKIFDLYKRGVCEFFNGDGKQLMRSQIINSILITLSRYFIVSIMLSFISTLVTYSFFPEVVKWILIKLGVTDISLLELQKINEELKLELESVKKVRESADNKLKDAILEKSKAIAEKEAVLQVMSNYKTEKVNYIALTVVILTIMGAGYYFFSNGLSGGDLTMINKSLLDLGETLSSGNSRTSQIITKSVVNSGRSLEMKLTLMEGLMEVINERLKELKEFAKGGKS